MKNRIYGLETEYGIALIHEDGRWTCDQSSLQSYLEYFRKFFNGQFMANGSRIYVDMDFHPEYCTAECLNILDMIAQDKAGDKMLSKAFNQYSKQQGVGKIHLFKNNVHYTEDEEIQPSTPITFGCHENFLMELRLGERELAPVLVPFLVVRQIIAGAGWVANPDFQSRNIKYTISQRDRFIGEVVSGHTHGGMGRAILCTARWDEPLSDNMRYKRLHLVVGDSNMSELSTYLKMATVGILLEMLEENYPFYDRLASFMPKDPVRAMHWVSGDLTCKKPVIDLIDGKSISAIDMLWVYVKMMEEYEKTRGMSPELLDAFKILTDILQRLEKREIDRETLMEINSQGLDEELDWLIKKSILEYSLKKFDCDWNELEWKKIHSDEREIKVYDQIRTKDLKYHDISEDGLYNDYVALPDLSPFEMRESQIRTPRMVEKEKIEYMEKNPPQNTRAKIRGEFVGFLEKHHLRDKFMISWDSISQQYNYALLNFRAVRLNDPFLTENEELNLVKRTYT